MRTVRYSCRLKIHSSKKVSPLPTKQIPPHTSTSVGSALCCSHTYSFTYVILTHKQ